MAGPRLGQVMAGWISRGPGAGAGPGALTLLGRSGRATSLSRELVDGAALVTAARCDVSQAEDAASGTVDRSVGALLHAGGVLLDATIPNQTAGNVGWFKLKPVLKAPGLMFQRLKLVYDKLLSSFALGYFLTCAPTARWRRSSRPRWAACRASTPRWSAAGLRHPCSSPPSPRY